MPWFCGHGSSHKKSKTKIGSVPISKDDSILVSTKPKFAVVLQNFQSSASDELTVRRGQVIEHLYTDKGWLYIRDVDGHVGYIPENFCYPLEQMGGSQWNVKVGARSPKVRPRPRTLNMDELSLSGSQTFEIRFENHPSDTTLPRCEAEGDQAAECKDTKPPESSESSGASSNVVRSTCLEDRNVNSSNNTQTAAQPVPTVTETQTHPDSRPSHTRRVRRANSYREAVSTSEKALSTRETTAKTSTAPTTVTSTATPNAICTTATATAAVATVATTTGNTAACSPRVEPAEDSQQAAETPHELVKQTAPAAQCDRLESIHSVVSHMTDLSMPDDVFLPDAKKPQGIYQCLEGYEARFKGELSLQRNEFVVVLEFGRGEWAWVFTSSSIEGLVPKALLVPYHPGQSRGALECTKQTNSTTQTELIVSHSLRQLSCSTDAVASSDGATASTSEGSIRSPDIPAKGRQRHRDRSRPLSLCHEKHFVSVGVQTECVSPNWFRDTDSEKSSQHCTPMTSPDRRPDVVRSVPISNSMRPKYLPVHTPTLSQCPSRLSSASPSARQKSLQQKRLVKSFESDRGYDSPGCASSRQPRFQHTPCLTAVSDYTPPLNAKNCLCLRKGDIVYQQPSASNANKGWMWTYHSSQRSFGFVPKSHVAYTYMVEKKPTSRDTRTLLEDEV